MHIKPARSRRSRVTTCSARCRQFCLRHTTFCGFVAEVNFEEDAERGGQRESAASAIQFLRQRKIVHRINTVKQIGGLGGLVALQMTDQVPGRR